MRKIILTLMIFIPALSHAESISPANNSIGFMNAFIIGLFVFIILVIAYILYVLKSLSNQFHTAKQSAPLFAGIFNKLSDSVPVEKEDSILTEHVYDGIRELDNNLPLWWKYMFYASILFGGIYLYYYHFTGSGKLQIQEYEQELAVAETQLQEFMKNSANSIDENNVEPLTQTESLENGKTLYLQNCAACHGRAGEGGVGPNLTDSYWLHGGGVKNIFKTIKYGVPENGMKSWKADFNPKNLQEITSYIMTLEGSNPPNAKDPQGEKY